MALDHTALPQFTQTLISQAFFGRIYNAKL
nr:MAG TPA: hypothetical protein [Caudoviricetes sp.]DAQ37661.1 MAG TPA: hypothetical protein [Caudoviricetes sp.]